MIEWGRKLKPKKSLDQKLTLKKSHAKFLSLNFRDTLALPQIFRLFELIPKKILGKVNPPKKILPILPKKIPESKISNPEKSFDHPHHLKSGVTPPPPNPPTWECTRKDWLCFCHEGGLDMIHKDNVLQRTAPKNSVGQNQRTLG